MASLCIIYSSNKIITVIIAMIAVGPMVMDSVLPNKM